MSKSIYELDNVRKLYAARVREHGEDPRALYWKGLREVMIRLNVLLDIESEWEEQSVLDVGCGFCNLFDILESKGFFV